MGRFFLRTDVLFEDSTLVAVDKPSGLLTVRDRWDREQVNLHDLLESKVQKKIFVVHRLDKDTSGIVLFAKTPEAHRALSLQFQTRFVQKEYLALVRGLMGEDSGTFTYPIAQDLHNPGVMITSPIGKPARTDFCVLERFSRTGYSWLSLKPLTGRTHQVRLHLRAAGHPVVGDPLYGSGEQILLSRLKKRYKLAKDAREKPLLQRMALHAYRLTVKHPQDPSTEPVLSLSKGSGQTMKFCAPIPKDLEITLRYLRKFGA